MCQRSRPASRRRSCAQTVAAGFALALLTTACLDIDMDLVVRDDGSGSITVSMRVDEAFLELAALGEGGDPEAFCDQFLAEADATPLDLSLGTLDSSSEAHIEDGDCIVTQVSSWDASESEAALAEMVDEDGSGLRRLGDGGWRFELDMTSLAEDAGAEDMSQISGLGFDFPTLTVSATLPGNAVEHNADSVNQSKYTWEIDFAALDGLPPSIYAETAPGSGLGPAAIGGIVAGIVLVLAALVTLRRHREAKAAEADKSAVSDDADAPASGDDREDADS